MNAETQAIISDLETKRVTAIDLFANSLGLTPDQARIAEDRIGQYEENLEGNYLPIYHEIVERAQDDAARLREESPARLTPYDRIDAESKVLLPEDTLVQALIERAQMLRVLNGPERMKVRRTMQEQPFKYPLATEIPVIERLFSERIMPAYDDFALGIQEAENPRVSRTKVFATGPWTHATKNRIATPYCGSSMPDCSGSPWAVASMAISGGLAFLPRDAWLNDPEEQARLAEETIKILKDPPFPFIEGVDGQEVERWWLSNLVGLVEANPTKALERTELLRKTGVSVFRVYSPEAGIELDVTTKALRAEFGNDVEIIAGMPSSGIHARRLVEAGADALVVGIGGGGICSTPTEAALAFEGLKVLYECRKKGIEVPIILESGIGRMGPLLLAIGASALAKSQAVFGGTIEQPGGAWYYQLPDGSLVKPYGGEASDRTRHLGGRPLDVVGRPIFREGDESVTFFNPLAPTVPHAIWSLLQSLSSALVFQRVHTIQELHEQEPIIWQVTEANRGVARVHHNNK
jgi:hypothetical protein